jgi:hypothetical protein
MDMKRQILNMIMDLMVEQKKINARLDILEKQLDIKKIDPNPALIK